MAESHPTRAARAAPPRKEFVVEEAPGPQKKIGESQSWTPWWGRMVVLLLVLSCLIWAILHGVAIKNQQELRKELQLLHENNEGRWNETWQKLLQLQQNQTELQRINKLLCQATEDSKKCPSGWQFYMNSCYFFSTHSRSWERARDFCRSFEGDLVVVSTEEEQYFLGKGVQGNNLYWMGVMDKGKWTWVTGKSPTFGFWDVWEEDPDRKLKHCGAMKANGRWTNERCSKYNPWICEKPWDCNFQTSF